MEQSKFFEAFMKQKKSPVYNSRSRSSSKFYFALLRDDRGLYVKTVNKSLKERSVNGDSYSGDVRSTVNLYNDLKAKTKLIVDWSNPYSLIYLDSNPTFLDALLQMDNLIDENGNPIFPSNSTLPITLNIKEVDTFFSCSLTISDNEISNFITDRHVLIENRILSTISVGDSFKSIHELNTIIKTEELGQYLSITLSNFKNLKINYKNYTVKKLGECELNPSLVVESIDDSGFLTISTTFSYNDLITPEFYYKYRPSYLAYPNHKSCNIDLYDLVLSNVDVLDNLIKILFFLEESYSLKESFSIEESGVIINPDLAHIMFSSEIKIILDNFSIFGEKFLYKNRLKRSKPNLDLLLRSSIGYLEGSASLKIYGEDIPLYKAISSYEEKGYIQLNNNFKGIIDKGYIEKIKKVIRKTKGGIEVSFFDLPFIENELNCNISGNDFNKKLINYKESKTAISFNIDLSRFNGVLRDYQLNGVRWMLNLHQIGISGCLADDMGLGKTVQAIVLLLQILHSSKNRPILIVVPKSLLFNWESEIEKFTTDLTCYKYYGESRDIDLLKKSQIVITTYHTLRNDIELIKDIEFYYTILDEIQNIKNHTSGLAKSCFLLKSEYKLGISGTPVENNLGDLYSISRFLNPTLFGSFKRFKDEWSSPILNDESEVVTNILRNKIAPLFLRRLKDDVLDDLPPKTEQVIYVDMSEKQKSLYERTRKKYHESIKLKIREEGIDKSKLTIIKAFMELRQIATIPEYKSGGLLESPKKDLVLENLIETILNGHKVLIFSNFLAAIKELSLGLDHHKIDHRIITGATGQRERVVEEFMDDPNIKVLVMTLKTGGVGLNLTAADYVYIMDPWWNLAAENQAIDRTHRIGQKSSVFCYRFICRGSIEEKILELQKKKKTLFENLFSPSKSSIVEISDKEIDYLLG
ncbi:DEAD/DEAH box helicase [Thiospirochaeta perfilievii]|uniref:DEAD/DEAH box helicase n=1 Tax=Thiospirochaeta perfilievii TaxID=252967 RepID=A0A5C1QC39_9SPIO|nr:DEAD/DEAH box helicase [Thiospirochaeta perfilievii]QEN04236.1 DEAD/DEAH box helicase [Thiospirochaeta perfilievii]